MRASGINFIPNTYRHTESMVISQAYFSGKKVAKKEKE
jgi:hypothetical protein